MATYTVYMSTVEDIILDMGKATTQISNMIDQTENDMKSTLYDEANWSTTAKNIWASVQSTWQQNITDMKNLMHMAESTLSGIVTNYDISEAQAKAAWSGIGY